MNDATIPPLPSAAPAPAAVPASEPVADTPPPSSSQFMLSARRQRLRDRATRMAERHAGAMGAARTRVESALAWVEHHRLLMALLSFGIGAGSFIMVERSGSSFARWIALLLVVAWLALLLESALGKRLAGYRWARFSPLVLRYATQNLHQETYFFCLPFLLATTTWTSGQAMFTSLGIFAALCSMWDPAYFGVIAKRPWSLLAFHAASMYLAALVLPPLLWQLDTTWSLAIASLTIGTLSIPSLIRVVEPRGRLGWTVLVVVALALAGTSWLLRRWVPPATLRTTRALMTTSVNATEREPADEIKTLTPEALQSQGLCSFMAIRAPRGLHEQISHRWIFNDQVQLTLPLSIAGGSDKGYRVWSCKHNFPSDPRGHWSVEAVTDAGQLIGMVHFTVADAKHE